MDRTIWTQLQCLYKGALYPLPYIHFRLILHKHFNLWNWGVKATRMSKREEAIAQRRSATWRLNERFNYTVANVWHLAVRTVLPERSSINITENICFSVVSVEVQMSSDMDLVTFGLCVHAATTAAEQSSYYTILISKVCSSSTHTHSLRYLKFYLCSVTQIHNYTLSGNRYDVIFFFL